MTLAVCSKYSNQRDKINITSLQYSTAHPIKIFRIKLKLMRVPHAKIKIFKTKRKRIFHLLAQGKNSILSLLFWHNFTPILTHP